MTKKIDYLQLPGLLHKNHKGEWGYWCERWRNCTAVYWQPASDNQIYYLEAYEKKDFEEYIKKQQRLYIQCLCDNPCDSINISTLNWYVQ